ncbi:hypothetical protein PCASD_16725 [Puccinia coronata f. sp. avenae]|uniref:RAVE complex protein Rav1 C-terminal domain-containing protein n=1 Tax=Puccinia coronata f. sp. avenae TaxID=200324 RepID=A0A2N5TX67_9BASI|nr:hypothetical protein PCASD_16725 [Puccinia coronata f. sp. avenae]
MNHQLLILSSINASRDALATNPSPSNHPVILYASGLVLNLLDLDSCRLLQSIHLTDHLPHLSSYHHSVDAVCLADDNRRLAASCGSSTAIFESSSSTLPTSWKLHSTFTCHISRILSIDLKQCYCLTTGKDGLSFHQLEQEETTYSDDQPPRWIKRWALRGQPADHSTFEILDDGTCVLAAIVVGSPILRTYEFSTASSPPAFNPHRYSPKTITLSLPIHSIRFSYDQSFPSKKPHPLPLLSVEVISPVLGIALHYYNLVRRPLAAGSGNQSQQPSSGPYKPSIQYFHHGMCAISVPTHSPRILASFPLDKIAERQNEQQIGHTPRLNVMVLSNGEIHAAQTTKNTTLVSTNFILPKDMLELFMRPGTIIQSVMSVTTSPGQQTDHPSYSIVARPLTPTGEMFVAQLPRSALLADPIATASRPQLISVTRLPFGHTPLLTGLNSHDIEPATLTGLSITTTTKDKHDKYASLCTSADDKSARVSQLLAYATQPELATSIQKDDPGGGARSSGCLDFKGYQCKDPANLIDENTRFLATLCVMGETDRTRTFRVVILDSRQHPYSPGIVGLDTFEVERWSMEAGNEPQVKWSDDRSTERPFFNGCFLGVCCGSNAVRIYARAIDGWWTHATTVYSQMGSISQVSWLASPDHSPRLVYRTIGHTLQAPPINLPQRLTLPPWHPALLKNQLLFGYFSTTFATISCLSLALKGSLQPLTMLSQRIVTIGLKDDGDLMIQELEELANESVLPENLSPTTLSQAHIDIISSSNGIPLLTGDEQASLLKLAKALLQVQTARSHGVDAHGCQYIFSLVDHLSHNAVASGFGTDLGFGPRQDCGILSAQLSCTRGLLGQETCTILSECSVSAGAQKLDWRAARSAGLFLWLESPDEVHRYLERVAQAEYMSGGGGDTARSSDKLRGTSHGAMEQDPAACSLFYLALSKKRLLVGLWNVAYGHADRPLMTKFLQNDFSQPRWKTAAQKNAFALLSRQRFRFAASFFLLADRLQDAVNVCVRQLDDWQLAVAIVRAYEGDRGAAMDKLLTTVVLPLGFSSGNRWLVSWCFRMLGEVELACRVLVGQWDDPLIRNRWTPSVHDNVGVRVGPLDLSLVLLFSRLKRAARSPLAWTEERALVLLAVDELMNAGCPGVAGWLMQNWHVDPPALVRPTPPPGSAGHPQKPQPSSVLSLPDPIPHPQPAPTPTVAAADPSIPLPPRKNLPPQPLVVPEFDMSNFF